MKKMMMVVMLAAMSGCATARYQAVPVGDKGAGVQVSWSAAAAEDVGNNWGKYLTALGAGFALYKAGDNSGWWGGGGDDSPAANGPITIYSVTGNNNNTTFGGDGNRSGSDDTGKAE